MEVAGKDVGLQIVGVVGWTDTWRSLTSEALGRRDLLNVVPALDHG